MSHETGGPVEAIEAPAPLAPFQAFVEAARRKPQAWRLALGALVVVFCWGVSTVGVLFVAMVQAVMAGARTQEEILSRVEQLTLQGSRGDVLLLLFSFVGVWLGLALVTWVLHHRSVWTLIGPERKIRWGEFAQGMGLIVGLFAIGLGVSALTGDLPHRTDVQLADWAIWLVPVAALTFLQTSAEEVLFRGYLVQQLAARFRWAVVWAGIPSLLFAAGHYANPQVEGAGIFYVGSTLMFALTAIVLTVRTGSLSAAMGAHFLNNLIFFAMTGVHGEGGAAALFEYDAPTDASFYAWDWVPTGLMLAFVLSPLNPIGRKKTPVSGN